MVEHPTRKRRIVEPLKQPLAGDRITRPAIRLGMISSGVSAFKSQECH